MDTTDDKSNDASESLADFCSRVSKEVESWPTWKQEMLRDLALFTDIDDVTNNKPELENLPDGSITKGIDMEHTEYIEHIKKHTLEDGTTYLDNSFSISDALDAVLKRIEAIEDSSSLGEYYEISCAEERVQDAQLWLDEDSAKPLLTGHNKDVESLEEKHIQSSIKEWRENNKDISSLFQLHSDISKLFMTIERMNKNRERSIAITKLQEANLWLSVIIVKELKKAFPEYYGLNPSSEPETKPEPQINYSVEALRKWEPLILILVVLFISFVLAEAFTSVFTK